MLLLFNGYYHNIKATSNIGNFYVIRKPFYAKTAYFTLFGEEVKHIFGNFPGSLQNLEILSSILYTRQTGSDYRGSLDIISRI